MIIFAMFLMGLLLGFVGAGGAGVVIAILSTVFNIPIHTALGTSLGAMVFTTISGTYSHYQENNIVIKSGIAIGLFGAIGAFIGAKIAASLPANDLKWLTAGMLFLSAILLAILMFFPQWINSQTKASSSPVGSKFWMASCGVGMISGLLSGTFGIGGTPYILMGLLAIFGMTVQQAAGTTMLITLPIALLGGIGYLTDGYLDLNLLAEVVTGLMTGTFIGAKFTRRLQPSILKATMICIPVLGGLLLLSK